MWRLARACRNRDLSAIAPGGEHCSFGGGVSIDVADIPNANRGIRWLSTHDLTRSAL
jgi:hypothetical protein